ncbi:MAG: UDP-N-acetylglucosamine 1-carboxyvinyltransferase [Ignavibacteriota bacterium]|jgi:UDP-N-acetylglucosamine 1-carboxyvinyltransferase|nr:UDP-N-acetylglucosamine 1-carboxyvinyltransferase [Ignavibacteriales bacterium]MBL1121570.1 UDP-N-acetylglucosamine 1-carboxyvinyltransferase [Ignavibacteriota bacterium]MBV6419368.1 UDP-N-acetylglucosamine 1-carboxyvinyltransferase [Ignavibacteriaceae bacterium]MCE7855242.1 UDP-N-acetylglucosamine 1-carboxyvinyltransferase [Ignavibacteria bacterium CHB3]MEB2296097.1 UDP-N-acetylglucosamine 1-carboxyvinyltransferase [Ignavibacteria bacterium]
MDKFVIKGGRKLSGSVKVSGSKNSSLALMPASILASGKSILKNTPELNDVYTMSKLLKHLGVEISFKNEILELDTSGINDFTAPYEHVKKMRASIYVLGPLLAKFGKATVSLPGGCAWGPRPVDLHIEAMKKLGANIDLKDGYIIAEAKKLNGAKINFDVSSVGATGNAMMAAALAKGTTLINNAAIEPEITQLAEFLVQMGSKINGVGTNKIEIEGVDELHPANIITIPDRIETGTLLIAAAITKSNINLTSTSSEYLDAVLLKLEDTGCEIKRSPDQISIDCRNIELKPVSVTTSIYPGFPTDMQAQWTSLMSIVNGVSTVTDSIYFDRFKHVPELNRLGAQIVLDNNTAIVTGVKKLKGAKVMSTDLRASATLVLAGLIAEGTTDVLRVYHLDRGYQRIEEKLKFLGADIQRVESKEY